MNAGVLLLPVDELLGIVVPIAVYWLYSGVYMLLGRRLDRYRLHPRRDEDSKNLVSKLAVVRTVLLQQLVQALVAFSVFHVTRSPETEGNDKPPKAPAGVTGTAAQFLVAMAVLDTWQYFWHRLMHGNRFLYKHVHSWHHRLVVPYAFGSQYNHPVEGLLLDTLGGAAAFLASGMSPRASILFFSLCTVKGVDDHCGLWLPGNPFHAVFANNTAYHDVHHQLHGHKFNFSQPFFVAWDRLLGTHMPYRLERRPGGGLEARPCPEAGAGSVVGSKLLFPFFKPKRS